jgi:hypothetical protein
VDGAEVVPDHRAVVIALFIGLSITAALGLIMVGALNLISVALPCCSSAWASISAYSSASAIARSVSEPDLRAALVQAGARAGVPLTLAAARSRPASCRSCRRLIAGVGARPDRRRRHAHRLPPASRCCRRCSTLHPPGEQERLGILLAPVDDFLERHRIPIIVATLGVAIAGLPPLFPALRFNPMNLRSPKVESIATYLDLRRDPATGANSINMIAPRGASGRRDGRRLKALPQVGTVRTIGFFVPGDQEAKLALIAEAAKALDPVLALPARAAPTDEEIVAALNQRAGDLTRASDNRSGPGAEAGKRLAAAMTKLAMSDPARVSASNPCSRCRSSSTWTTFAIYSRPCRSRLDNLPQEIARIGAPPTGRSASRSRSPAIPTTMKTSARLRAPCSPWSRAQPADRSPSWNPVAPS